MNRFIPGILTVIALGLLLVAYGLFSRSASAYGAGMMDPYSMTYVPAANGAGGYMAYIVPVGPVPPSPQMVTFPGYANPMAVNPYAVQTVQTAPAPRPVAVRRAPSRNWGKTAMVIGGSSAAGAGIGGLIGGKKGALIGAAIGGGASTLYESTK